MSGVGAANAMLVNSGDAGGISARSDAPARPINPLPFGSPVVAVHRPGLRARPLQRRLACDDNRGARHIRAGGDRRRVAAVESATAAPKVSVAGSVVGRSTWTPPARREGSTPKGCTAHREIVGVSHQHGGPGTRPPPQPPGWGPGIGRRSPLLPSGPGAAPGGGGRWAAAGPPPCTPTAGLDGGDLCPAVPPATHAHGAVVVAVPVSALERVAEHRPMRRPDGQGPDRRGRGPAAAAGVPGGFDHRRPSWW